MAAADNNFRRRLHLVARIGLPLAVLLTSAASVAARDGFPTDGKERQQWLQKLSAAADQHDCKAVLKLTSAANDIAQLKGERQDLSAAIVDLRSDCLLNSGDTAGAYRLARVVTDADLGSDLVWRVRLAVELQEGRHKDALATMLAMGAGHGSALNSVQPQWIYSVARHAKMSDDKAGYRALLKLLAESWASDEPLLTNDYFRRGYAQLLVTDGDHDGARAALSGVTNPAELVRISLDKDLKGLLPDGTDIRAATENALADARRVANQAPNLLSIVLEEAHLLRMLGQPKDALALLDKIGDPDKMPASYADLDQKRPWFWDEYGRTYYALGRVDESLAILRKGAAVLENGVPNVSQVLNLAAMLVEADKPAEALAVLTEHEKQLGGHAASPFGIAVMRSTRACAYARLNELPQAQPDREYLAAHREDNASALTDVLLCMGDKDAAAAEVIRRLSGPDTRAAMLLALSDFDPPAVKSPFHPFDETLPLLKERADVQAAIAQAGGTARFHIRPDELSSD